MTRIAIHIEVPDEAIESLLGHVSLNEHGAQRFSEFDCNVWNVAPGLYKVAAHVPNDTKASQKSIKCAAAIEGYARAIELADEIASGVAVDEDSFEYYLGRLVTECAPLTHGYDAKRALEREIRKLLVQRKAVAA